MSSNGSVTVSMVVRADPAAAFRVFTEEIDAWWKRGERFRRHHGVMHFEGGSLREGIEPIGRVLAWEPGVRLRFELWTWGFRPGEPTQVEVRFEPVGDGTRVTVEHRGWEPRGAGEFRTVVGLWWGTLLPAMQRRAITRYSSRAHAPGTAPEPRG
jgi:hypothetical protein